MRSKEEMQTKIARQIEVRDNLRERIREAESQISRAVTAEEFRTAQARLVEAVQAAFLTSGALAGMYYALDYPEDEVLERLIVMLEDFCGPESFAVHRRA